MLIRSKNRLYVFDRHISDAVLRLCVVFLAVLFGLTSYLFLAQPDVTIDAIFWPRLQTMIADLTGSESTIPGSSQKSIYTIVTERMEKEKALLTQFPEYAEKIFPNNKAVETVRLKLRDLRIVVLTIGLVFLALTLLLALVARIIYGSGESRFRLIRWLFITFNNDGKDRQPHFCARFFSGVQRKVFEMAFAASKGNADGSFEFDVAKFYHQMFPAEETVTDVKRGILAGAFTELCEDYFYFPMPFGRSFLLKAFCPVVPFEETIKRTCVRNLAGQEVEVYIGGRFRFSPPLYRELLMSRYSLLPHPVAYGIDDRKHPYAFRIYLYLWEKYIQQCDEENPRKNPLQVAAPLYDLLENICFEMSYGHEKNLLDEFHSDVSMLKEVGMVRSWYIEEHGSKLSHLWFKDAELFLFESTTNTYHLNTNILSHKMYYFEMAPMDALEKIKVARRRCAYLDEYDTPCNRPALPNSPYCKRHAKVLEYDGNRIFHGKVKALEAPAHIDEKKEEPAGAASPPPVIVVPPKTDEPTHGEQVSDHGKPAHDRPPTPVEVVEEPPHPDKPRTKK